MALPVVVHSRIRGPLTVDPMSTKPGRVSLSELMRGSIPEQVKIRIWARSAGRCVLCSTYLIDERWQRIHYRYAPLVGELAHNVGATSGPGSPRSGGSDLSKAERRNEDNILLLCHPCHRSVDAPQYADLFTVDWVRQRKDEHELRVRKATNFATLRRTLVISTRGPVRGAEVHVSDRQIAEALIDAGLVLHVEDGSRGDVVIDLDGDLTPRYAWQLGRDRIDKVLKKLCDAAATASQQPDHIAVFALAPIPLLVYLGARLDDTTTVTVFDRHRGQADRSWCWPDPAAEGPRFEVNADNPPDRAANDVVATLNVSGTVRDKNIPAGLSNWPGIGLHPVDTTPQPGLIGSERCLETATTAWRELLARVEATWPNTERLHLLAAVPASLAVRLGSHIMRTAHWDTIVYQLTDRGYIATPPIHNNDHDEED
jgi:5-methylcytosine-specific restriction endonuclease McrA